MRITAPGIQPQASLEDQQRQQFHDDVASVVNGLGQSLTLPGSAVVETLKADNALWLAQGVQGGLSLSAQRTRLAGGTGAFIGGVAGFASTAVVSGLDFQNAVNLSADSRSVFIGCTFRQDSVAQLIAAKAGAKATFTGCAFYGSGLTSVVDNPGVITDIVLLGCYNATGAAAGNVTEIGGV